MLPDTGADEIILGPEHLNEIDVLITDLKPPPANPRFMADGSPIKPAFGSFKAELRVRGKTKATRIDVLEGTPDPLLFHGVCKGLALISENFSHPISKVTHVRMGTLEDTRQRGPTSSAISLLTTCHS